MAERTHGWEDIPGLQASTAAFCGVVEEASEGPANDKDCLRRFTLGENGPAFTAEESAVINLLKSPSPEPPPESMITPLIAFMCKAETNEAYQAAAQVARVGPPAISPLVTVLRTDRKPASWRAAWALGKMGRAAEPAVDDLNEMLRRTQDTRLREIIAEALASIR